MSSESLVKESSIPLQERDMGGGESQVQQVAGDVAIRVQNLSKCYQLYDRPEDRLKQAIYPRLRRLMGMEPKNYAREFWALRDVPFEVKKGETVGIIGRNGSGKSTLLQLICGTLAPTYGTVETNGRVAALLELGAGFNPEFTGRENVYMNGALLGLSRQEIDARFDDIAAFADIGQFIDQLVKTYSSGMYARLAFSIAIHVDPEVLIIDETLAVGDARFIAKCMRRIKDIQDRGTTILFVSHDVSSVRTLCDRAIWLEKGCLHKDGDVFPVTGEYMEYMFSDEESEEMLRQKVVAQQQSLAQKAERQLSEHPSCGKASQEYADIEAIASIAVNHVDSRPVTHWGSRKGVIQAAYVCDEHGIRKDVHAWGRECEIVIRVCVPEDISREHLSVAFSIKDLKGTDLIVSATQDLAGLKLPDEPFFTVSFSFVNPLVTGKYLLVAAVENRLYRDIHYYEYIEGAHYFSSLADQRFLGIFQPEIRQVVTVER